MCWFTFRCLGLLTIFVDYFFFICRGVGRGCGRLLLDISTNRHVWRSRRNCISRWRLLRTCIGCLRLGLCLGPSSRTPGSPGVHPSFPSLFVSSLLTSVCRVYCVVYIDDTCVSSQGLTLRWRFRRTTVRFSCCFMVSSSTCSRNWNPPDSRVRWQPFGPFIPAPQLPSLMNLS